MNQPLALIFYEQLMPGTHLANQLQDLGYRVRSVTALDKFVAAVQEEPPMIILADAGGRGDQVCGVISEIMSNPQTRHIPVIAFTDEGRETLQEALKSAGVTLVVTDKTILTHLSQFLSRALEVD